MNREISVKKDEKPRRTADRNDTAADIPNEMPPDERINRARPENPFCEVEIE